MPRFDGTGPRGQGPMTGRGEGYCVIRLPEPGQPAYAYPGQQGIPVPLDTPASRPPLSTRLRRWPPPTVRQGRAFRRGRGRGAPGVRLAARSVAGRWPI